MSGSETIDNPEYCREIEAYLCRKNDGHLIRITGPSFEIVSGWAEQGIPIKVVFSGIDRTFERYYRKGPRRRPVKIDFCDADVLDVFDDWRRAVGVSAVARPQSEIANPPTNPQSAIRNPQSLRAHIERALTKLSSARAKGTLGAEFDELIDRVSNEFDAARASTAGLRGAARQATLDRLAAADRELLRRVRESLPSTELDALGREAERDLASFRTGMTADAFARAREGAIDRLVRERFALPTIAFE